MMSGRRQISRPNLYSVVGSCALFACSWYLLLIRLIWLDDSKPLWWAYQVAHLALFALLTGFVLSAVRKHIVLVILVVSVLIGLIPYENWFSLFADLTQDSRVAPFSDFTQGMPVLARVVFEVGFFPTLQLLIFAALFFVLRTKVIVSSSDS